MSDTVDEQETEPNARGLMPPTRTMPADDGVVTTAEAARASTVMASATRLLEPRDDHTLLDPVLGQADAPAPSQSSDPLPRGTAALVEGSIVDHRYVLLSEVGRGGFAVVWRARDEIMSRDIALKLFNARGKRDPAAVGVLMEAQANAKIASEYVVRVYDSFIDEELGVAAIVMELCQEAPRSGGEQKLGAPLRPKSVSGVESVRDARKAARRVHQAALGVGEAHVQNVFHRDLKPANILVRPFSGRCQVLDFGLSAHHVARSDSAPTAAFAAFGNTVPIEPTIDDKARHIAGTPEYMAPEQARGVPYLDAEKPADRATLVGMDVYGLGAVLFTLLTGVAPREASPNESTQAVLARAVRNEVPWELLKRGRIPTALADCVRKALAKNPKDRYQSVDHLAAELGAFLAYEPTEPEKKRPLRRVVLAYRRNPLVVDAVIGAVAMLSIAVWTALTARAAEAQKADAKQEVSRLHAQAVELKKQVAAQKTEAARFLVNASAREHTLKQNVDEAEKRRKAIEAELGQATETGRSLSDKLRIKEAQLWETKTKLDLAMDQVKTREAELSRLRGERDALRGERDALRNERDSLRSSMTQKDVELGNVRGQLANKARELDTKQGELASAQGELENKTRQISEKERALAEKTTQLDEARSEIGRLNGVIESLRQVPTSAPTVVPPPPPTASR